MASELSTKEHSTGLKEKHRGLNFLWSPGGFLSRAFLTVEVGKAAGMVCTADLVFLQNHGSVFCS